MRRADLLPGRAYLLVGGTNYRVIDSIDGGRVRWHNEAFLLKSCSVAQFLKACEREMTEEDERRLGLAPEGKLPRI